MVRGAVALGGRTAVVIGAGPIGLMFCVLLWLAGAQVVVLEPAEHRAAVAGTLGAACVADPARDDTVALVRELTDGRGADVVVDAVGSQLAAALALGRQGVSSSSE